MKNSLTLVLFLSFVSYTTGFSQKAIFRLSCDKTIVEEEFPVSLKIETNQQGVLNFDVPASFVKRNTSNTVSRKQNPTTRQVEQTILFTQHGLFTKEGTYKIRATLNVDGKLLRSNQLKIKVVKKTKPALKDLNLEQA